MKYINKTPFNNGIRLTGQSPLDDRTVIDSKSELHITTSSPQSCPLYNKAYEGLSLSVADENYETYICIDATPYTPGKVVNVNASNLTTYWKRSEQTIYDYVHGEVDTYIRTPHIKVNSQWVKCTSTLSPTGIKGIDYVINASIDNDSLKVTNNILAGYKYKLYKETLEDSDPLYAAYKLQYKAPGAEDWANDPVRIEIPKISVVKSVKLCKAVPDPSQEYGYRVTAYQGDPNWDTAEGDVYLRIEWDNDTTVTNGVTDVTYLKVGDIIKIDIKPLENRLDSLESSTYKLEVSTGELQNRSASIESSIGKLQNRSASLESSIGELQIFSASLESSIGELQIMATVLEERANAVDTSLSNLYDIENVHYTSLNSSLGALKTYVDTTVNSSINELARKIDNDISTAVVELGASITELRNYVDTSLNAAVSALDASIKSLKSYVDVTITNNINDISSHLASNVQTINRVVADLSTYAHVTDASQNASIGVLDASTKHLDVSVYDIYEYYREQTGVWAGAWNKFVKAWNQFRSNNPTLDWNNVDTFDGNEAIIPN